MTANIDEIKRANLIEDVINETPGFGLGGHGRYRRAQQHNSLVVDVHSQYYVWNSTDEKGDVINWVMEHKRMDFKSAVEFLARRANMDEPVWSGENGQLRLAARAREDALTVACRRFVHQLWRTKVALDYVRGRGWDDEAIKAAGLGYTGGGTKEELDELRDDFERSGVDPESPGAVAFLGYRGDVRKWVQTWDLAMAPADWMTGKASHIPPIWKEMLVYAHVEGGRVRYASLRGVGEKKHMNLREALVGARKPYYNHAYSPQEEQCVVVEGQADAVTLGQWGIPAVGLAGVSGDAELLRQLKRHKHLYVGLDQDDAGDHAGWSIARALGSMTRMVRWPAKDANDVLQAYVADGLEAEDQTKRVKALLDQASPFVLALARRAGMTEGPAGDEAVKDTMEVVASMEDRDLALYRERIRKAMGLSTVREFNNLQSQTEKELDSQADKEEEEGIQETVGGYIKGWLVELLYREDERRTLFAYRDPDGKIGTAYQLEIEGVTYKPLEADDLITQGVVVLPSDIGPELRESELIEKIVKLVNRYYLIDTFYAHLIAYYVTFTWFFDSFRDVVYLRALGEWGSGKSRLLSIVGYLSRRMIRLTGAASDASFFRTMHAYKGTLFIDEGDRAFSDTNSLYVKILNSGSQRDLPVIRQEETGGGKYVSRAYDVFGPKLVMTRERFDDEALESRCLTVETIKHTSGELVARGIPLHMDKTFYDEAAALRNEMLRWRLRIWQPDVEIDQALVDPMVEPRLNQVMMPVKQIVKDEQVRKAITDLVRRYQSRMTTEKSMRLEAKILQAILQIHDEDPVTQDENGNAIEPYWDLSIGNIARYTNAIIDAENAEDEDEEDDPEVTMFPGQEGAEDKKKNRLKARRVGSEIDKKLKLTKERASSGPLKGKIVVVWEEERINGLRVEYGLMEDE